MCLFDQHTAVLNGFFDVLQQDGGRAVEVGDGAGHAQDAVVGAARPFELLHAFPELGPARAVELAVVVDLARRQVLVEFALPLALQVGRCLYARGNHGGALAFVGRSEDVGMDRGHFHLDIDAVQQRAGDAVLVTQADVCRAAAGHALVAVVAARAGIHGGDQLEVGGEVGMPCRARDGDVAGFHRLAQHVQHAAVELGQLVEEQHAAMGQRDLAGARHAAAAHQRRAGGGVVRGAKRPPLPLLDVEAAGQRLHGGRFQRFLVAHRRQQADEARGQHGLARARRSHEQHRMVAGRRHFKPALDQHLSLDVGKVRVLGHGGQRRRFVARQHAVNRLAGKVAAHLQQRVRRINGGARHQCGLVGIGQRQDERQTAAVAPGGQRHRQRATDRPQFAGQRQFAGILILMQAARGDLLGGGKDAERDWQVEAPSYRLLRDCGRLNFIL